MGLSVGDVDKGGELSVRVGRHGCHFIAKPQIDRKVWTQAPIVLYVEPEDRLSGSKCVYRIEGARLEPARRIREEILQRVEGKGSTGQRILGMVVLQPLHRAAEFDGVGSVRPKRVVVCLECVPVYEEVAFPVYATREER